MAHFKESGSILSGKVLETYEEFPALDVATALRRLQIQVPDEGVSVISVDANQGIIECENKAPNARPFPIRLTVTATSSGGARVHFWAKLKAGQTIGNSKPYICKMLRLATSEPPAPAAEATPAPSSSASNATEVILTNEAVVKLSEAELGDEIVIAKIKTAPKVVFDVSTDALVALKKAKVNNAVIAAMIERAAFASAPSGAPASPPSRTAEPPQIVASQDPCAGIELMGLYQNEAIDRAIGGGIVEWLAKIRNNTGATKIVEIGWRDIYGQEKTARVQIRGGEIASPRLDMTQARAIPPVSGLRVLRCE